MMKPPIIPPYYHLPRDLIPLDRRAARERFCKVVQAKQKTAGQDGGQGLAGLVPNESRHVNSVSGEAQ